MKPTTLLLVICLAPLRGQERGLTEAVARLKTDDRIAMFETLAQYKPLDFHYQNQLAAGFLQKLRETMDPAYLDRASRIVSNVLASEGSNYEALRLRSAVELERHNFPKVAEYSRELTRTAPDDPWNWGTLGDALMEQGKYSEAAEAYQTMVRLRPDLSSYNRAAYYHFVAGDAAGAVDIMKRAIDAGSRSPENIAWCLSDLGNMYFKIGSLGDARRAFEAALRLFPGYHPANAGLGRVAAAEGNLATAAASFEKASAVVPLPEYAAALEDLYAALGRQTDARKQRERIDLADRMERAAGNTNRNLALVYADHGRHPERALELARAELKVRNDVYTWDALAWTLYKSGSHTEAREASRKALELGTPEPAFHYHAGMIALALGENREARTHLERALALNPAFDLRQAQAARAALREVKP